MDDSSAVKEVDDVLTHVPAVTLTDATSKVTSQTIKTHEVKSFFGRIYWKLRPSVAPSSSMMEDKSQTDKTNNKPELLEELHQIDKTIEKAKLENKTESDKDNLIGNCQSERREIETQVKDLSMHIDYLPDISV